MKTNVSIFIDEINRYAVENKLFWIASMAKDCFPILKNHINELHPLAKLAIEHYLHETGE